MPSPFRHPINSDSSRSGTRLEGWKTIAAYLDKAERTVKRWESDRGLPIHRVPGGGRAVVYCIASELDAWLESNRTYAEHSPTDTEASNTSLKTGQKPEPETPVANVLSPAGAISPSRITHALALLMRRRFLLTAVGLLLMCVTATALHYTTGGMSNKSVFGPPNLGNSNLRPASSATVSEADKVQAQDLYLKGRFEWNKRTPESLNRALDYFTQSIVHDPANARTYAGLADTYILLHEYSLMSDREAESRALAAATKAVALNNSLAEAHRSLAFAEVWGNWDFRAGEREFLRAIELDPNDPLTHLWFATAFNTPEWNRVTAAEFDRAQELDPTSPVILSNKSIWLFEMGHRQAGIDLAQQVERDDPDFVAPHRYLARMNWDLHDYSDFLAETEKTADLTHDQNLKNSTVEAKARFRKDGERGMLDSLYRSRKRLYEDGKLAGTSLAEVCIRRGLRDEAVQLIQHDYDQRRAAFLWIFSEPEFETLKSDQRYVELTKKVNYPDPLQSR